MLTIRTCFVILALIAGQVYAQEYPNKPLRIVTGATGGGIDFGARQVGDALATAFGQSTVIDNRGGGGGILAGDIFSKSEPDGYTLMVYSGNIWLLPLLRKSVPYDPIRDFAPVIWVSSAPNTLLVHPSLPVHSVKDLIALAKAQPGKLNYAHGGVGGSVHLAAELFLSMTGINIVSVAYKSNTPAYADLMSGRVQAMFAVMTSAQSFVDSGRLRAIAVSTLKPTPLAPGLPTIAESGVPGYENLSMISVFAPAKTSPTLIKRLNETLNQWMAKPATKKRYLSRGTELVGGTPEKLGALVKADMAKWRKVIKERGIGAQ